MEGYYYKKSEGRPAGSCKCLLSQVSLHSLPDPAGEGRTGESLPSIEDVVTVASPADNK